MTEAATEALKLNYAESIGEREGYRKALEDVREMLAKEECEHISGRLVFNIDNVYAKIRKMLEDIELHRNGKAGKPYDIDLTMPE